MYVNINIYSDMFIYRDRIMYISPLSNTSVSRLSAVGLNEDGGEEKELLKSPHFFSWEH
jgi:hypothetical protein